MDPTLAEVPAVPFARAGSQKWLQVAVERRPALLLEKLRPVLNLDQTTSIEWVSPRAADGFQEYRGMGALRKLGIGELPVRPFQEFWPSRGAVWDALGKTSEGVYIFIEAKANIPEAASSGTKAVHGSDSYNLIRKSLEEARRFYAPRARAEWSGTFYQYANRLAHHYFLREINGLPAHLVFLYFVNADEVDGPKAEDEWRGAIHLLHAVLGLGKEVKNIGVHEVFLDADELRPIVL